MFERFAIYYTARGAFASRGAAWLGWDIELGQTVPQPAVAETDLADITGTPRRYGFHGTLKPPFRLAAGKDENSLRQDVQRLATRIQPVVLEGVQIAAMGRFLALCPVGDTAKLSALAAQVVRLLDPYRAPLTEQELERRRKHPLSPAQEENLRVWGYPHVMGQFRFHMTLTNRIPRNDLATVKDAAQAHFAQVLPEPFVLDAITLVGQRPDGMFVSIERYPLSGPT